MENIINNKNTLNSNNDKEVVEFVKSVILKNHPIDDRIDMLLRCPSPAMDIRFDFYEDQEKTYTDLFFMDGNDNYMHSLYDSLTIDGLVSEKVIIDLVKFILTDHDYISSFSFNDGNIFMNFKVDLKDENMYGITCGTIGLNFYYYQSKNSQLIKQKYSKLLISNFIDYMKNTEFYKKAYKTYTTSFKSEFISKISEENLYKFIKLIDKDTLKNILINMPFESFINAYNEMQEDYPADISYKKLLK